MTNEKILQTVKLLGGTLLCIGISTFLTGLFVSKGEILAAIGAGTIVGAVFIFLMGIFFVASGEVLEKTQHKNKKRASF